jgi:hypothetical protein
MLIGVNRLVVREQKYALAYIDCVLVMAFGWI